MRMAGNAIELRLLISLVLLSCIHLTAVDLAMTQGQREPQPRSSSTQLVDVIFSPPFVMFC